jgi:transposase
VRVHLPKEPAERLALAAAIGRAGQQVLDQGADPGAPAWLAALPALETLRQVWAQQYTQDAAGVLHWRAAADLPPAAVLVASPHDPEAHSSKKRETTWVGDTGHLTETGEAAAPHVITQVTTTAATVPDSATTGPILAELAARGRLPSHLVVESGYSDVAGVVAAQDQYSVHVLGPVRADTSGQTRAAAGFSPQDFRLDWARQAATCPQGQQSTHWPASTDRHKAAVIRVRFADRDHRRLPHAKRVHSVHDQRTQPDAAATGGAPGAADGASAAVHPRLSGRLADPGGH